MDPTARRDGASEAYTIRPFASPKEFRECVELQEATWGEGFSERVSPAILQIAQILGGISSGAYDRTGRLAGFVFGLTGVRDGAVVHWSDMLAVRPDARDSGLGRRLKLYQREEMLTRGIDTVVWTFDPLQSRNAHLNITRLGAVIREYRENMYGETDSPLHRGIGTDRFVALWRLDSQRVRARVAGERAPEMAGAPHALAASQPPSQRGDAHPRPGPAELTSGNDVLRVSIPSDIGGLMNDDPDLALEWRLATRRAFEHLLSAGYEVVEFERGEWVSDYLISRIRDRT